MKRFLAVFLAAALMALGGCGAPAERASSSASAPSPTAAPTLETDSGYVIPAAWTEDSINDGTWGYVTQGADLPCGEGFSIEDGYLVSIDRDLDAGETTLVRCTLAGEELGRVVVPTPKPDGDGDSSVGFYAFGENGIWLTYDQYQIVDQDTGETEVYTELQKWSYDGDRLVAVPIDSSFGQEGGDPFLMGMDLSPDGSPVLVTEHYIYFCDDSGQPTASIDTAGTYYGLCRDSTGRLYLRDTFAGVIYAIDWEACALGQPVLTTANTEQVMPGGGGYDFFLSSDSTLRGVTLSTGTITEILSWADWDLAGSTGGVAWLDEETFLVSTYSLLSGSSSVLTLSRMPAAEIPEKTAVRLAVGLSEDNIAWGQTWTDALDQTVTEAINEFNRESGQYRVEVETYASGEALSLQILSGDAPDIIDWNSTAWLEDPPSMAIYAKRGYLVDLEPLFASDPELSLDDFIPSILALVKERTGGLYAMPLSFYFATLSVSKEYVGDKTTWTVSDLLAAARQMPEDMELWEAMSQDAMLDTMLRESIDHFVDISAGTCDFENQEFYDLLTLCRDYCPAETGENYVPAAGGSLLMGEASLGRLGQFASDVMRPLEDQGRVLIGYPGAGGSGVSIIFYDDYTICALGQQQEGAWEFLRTLYTYDFQHSTVGPMCSVRQDAFNDKEDRYLEVNGSCTEEESQAARELVYQAANCRVNDSPIIPIVEEETAAFFNGDKTAEETAAIIQSRVEIYLGEQS